MEVVVRKDDDKWSAWVGDKRIAVGNCQSCVVKLLLAVTKKSSWYDRIAVYNEDGSLHLKLPTGDGSGRQAAKGL